MKAIEAFVSLRDGAEKFSWNKATQVAFGEGKFGANYKAKLVRILEKFNIEVNQL